MKDIQKFASTMSKAGVRPTSVRILIYQTLEKMHDTFSMSDIEDMIPSLDKSSIFRTLSIFNEHNLIHSVDDGSGSLKYCFCHNHGECQEEEEHCHFYCEHCQKTFCLENDLVPGIDLPEGFVAHRINYLIKGICAECSKKLK